MRGLFLLALLIVTVTCATTGNKFTSTDATVQINGGLARNAVVVCDFNSNVLRQEIRYTFGVKEHELYQDKSRFQSCPAGGCANYLMNYPMANYAVTGTPTDTTAINGVQAQKYPTTTENGYSTTLWVKKGATDVFLKVQQTGPGFNRIITFNTFTPGSATFTSPPSSPSCQTVECNQALDLMLVLDSSGSITDADYDILQDFSRELVDSFTISNLGVHIGLVTFATEVNLRIRLSSSETAILNAINNANQQYGQTNIGGAILAAHNELNTGRGGAVPKVMIVLTDGRANEPRSGTGTDPVTYMINKANDAKNSGILIYAIGVGNQVDLNDLADIASAPQSSYTALAYNFEALIPLITGILEEVCTGGSSDTCPTTCKSQEFCGCGSCICTLDSDYCGSRGTFNSGTCECTNCVAPYTNAGGRIDCKGCSNICQHSGTLNSDCSCSCTNQWSGSDCSLCNVSCGPNYKNETNCQGCTCPATGTGWSGTNCDVCTLCKNGGTANSACTSCTCPAGTFWTAASNCQTCGLTSAQCPSANTNGKNSLCTGCSCKNFWSGTYCDSCSLSCVRGTPKSDCSACNCPDMWSGTTCNVCPPNACGSHGSPNTACNSCNCDTNWDGDKCDVCTLDCGQSSGRGAPNADCTACVCNGAYSGTACSVCDTSVCKNGGTMNDCSIPKCNCIGFWKGDKCDSCNSNALCNGHGTASGTTCTTCTCNNDWSGTRCDTCIDNCVHGQKITSTCAKQCQCLDFWTGLTCNTCPSTDRSKCNNRGTVEPTNCDVCQCEGAWGGKTCNICNYNCNSHGFSNAACNGCSCSDGWTVASDCSVCDSSALAPYCNNRGPINNDNGLCNSCTCPYPWSGNKCQTCIYDCHGNGTPKASCDSCTCSSSAGYTAASDCEFCDASPLASFCNGRGSISNPDTGCNQCECTVNEWEGTKCNQCNIDCNSGTHNSDCSGCTCPAGSFFDPATNCEVCTLECANGGTPNAACTECICTGGYTKASNCNDCASSYFNTCVHASGLDDNCECDCTDKWEGTRCNQCDLTDDCNAPDQGARIDFVINGVPQCRCECLYNFVGDNCDECGLETGDYHCDGLSEPHFEDCTCHCPEYYRDEEGCRECIITFEDCVHPKEGSTVDTTVGICECTECDGNWSGRDCSECHHECSEGYYLDETICECYTICGDEYLVTEAGEECEAALIEDDNDLICCDDCKLVDVACNDQIPCTIDDRCLTGDCQGVPSIDFEIDQNRNPLPLGTLNAGVWSRWGVSVTKTSGYTLNVVNTNAPTNPIYKFPSTSQYNGDFTPDNILRVQHSSTTPPSTSQVCFNFNAPTHVDSTVVVSLAHSGASITFGCSQSSPVSKLLIGWGVGSAQLVTNTCPNQMVTSVCYNKIQEAGIAGIYLCEAPISGNIGRIGDYVWHDFSVDDIQDSNEIGIPSVTVRLFQSNIQLAEQRTTSAGLYLFDNLFAGTYEVAFIGPTGYRFSTPRVVLQHPNIPHQGSIKNIVLSESKMEDLTVDVGLYLFGSIGDYVFLDENKNGIQDEAVGVSGVTMKLYFSDADFSSTPLKTTTTNSAGIYKFDNLPVYRTPTSFASYVVVMVPPPTAVVTQRFAGSDRALDSNFDTVTYRSDVVSLSPTQVNDITIDAGIYYCCGSIGDFVFIDDNKDGIQQASEVGVPGVTVKLFFNGQAFATTTTDSAGKYLFTQLPISVHPYYVYFTRPSGYLFTKRFAGTDRALDSNVDSNGKTDNVILTNAVPDVLTMDAGVVTGCTTADECIVPDECVENPRCVSGSCVFSPKQTCAKPANVCFDAFCDPDTGGCIEVPTAASNNRVCNDNNSCTKNDVCIEGGVCRGVPDVNKACNDGNECTLSDVCGSDAVCRGTPRDCNAGNLNPCIMLTCNAADGSCTSSNVDGNTCSDNNPCTLDDVCAGGSCSGVERVCTTSEVCKEAFCSAGSCSTRSVTNGLPCDDGNACTINDACVNGVCTGTPSPCSPIDSCHVAFCDVDGSCVQTFKSTNVCDDGDSCTTNICDPISRTCQATQINCDDNNVCTTDSCVNGSCRNVNVANGSACDDGDLCTTNSCQAGVCQATVIECEDNNPCTDDFCVAGECEYLNNQLSCDDGNACTQTDLCTDGVCSGVDIVCNDNDPCTDDFCEGGECKTTPNTGRACDDGDYCSRSSVCVEGVCEGRDYETCADVAVDLGACEELYCVVETGICASRYVQDNRSCDDGNECTQNDTCDTEGECNGEPTVCDDGNPCTEDFCFGADICDSTPLTDATIPCDDGDECTIDDQCVEGTCTGTPMDCDDENNCTTDYCSEGVCVNENNSNPCDDGNDCTVRDTCVEGTCVGESIICTPRGVCFDSECVAGECVETPNNASCDDGNECTLDDICSEGFCAGQSLIGCRSTNPCVVGECNPQSGECEYSNVDAACDDGNACTENDLCVDGTCRGTEKSCSGDNICLDYACNPETGSCDETPNNDVCDDGNACTRTSSCVGGHCVGGSSVVCSSSSPCVSSTCNPVDGTCEETNIDATCSDFDSCTENDRCENGECVGDLADECKPECEVSSDCTPNNACESASCVSGVCRYSDIELDCEDRGPCYESSCDTETGACVYTETDNACDDNNACTQVDFCVAGECVGTQPEVCATRQCFVGTCDAESGDCVYTPTPNSPCNDNDACTVNDVCDSEGQCSGSTLNCNDGNVCTDDICVDGVCRNTNNIRFCNDGDACTENDQCTAGTCRGTQIECDERDCFNVECRDGSCFSTPTTDSCDDGNSCTQNDTCFNGVCRGEEIICESDNVCVENVCRNGACVETFTSSPCDDGNACTVRDTCVAGQCLGRPLDCSDLDDDCSRGVCREGECVAETSSMDGNECDAEGSCVENGVCVSGSCVGSPVSCTSTNPCSVGSCIEGRGCVYTNNPVSCESGNACSVSSCINQRCVEVADAIVCDDNNSCTNDSCDPNDGSCVHTFSSANSCSDGNPCTNDVCTPNGCESTQIVCDDKNECTDDFCENGVCRFVPNFAECEHSNPCVSEARCGANLECIPVNFVSCRSNNPCAEAFCDASTGACNVRPHSTVVACDDNNACTTDEVCLSDMTCGNGSDVVCTESSNPCTRSECRPNVGCVEVNDNTLSCSNDDPCSTQSCVSGSCVTSAVNCVDSDPCTFDHICTEEGCTFDEFSCVLSPCLYLECRSDKCAITTQRDSYRPQVYMAFSNPSEEHFIAQFNLASLDADLIFESLIQVSNPVVSLGVQPMSGNVYAIGGPNADVLYQIPKSGNGTLRAELNPLSTDLSPKLDLSFKPIFQGSNTRYDYQLWGLTRTSDPVDFYSFSAFNFEDSPVSDVNPDSYIVSTWDNHGRYIFGVVGTQLHAWDTRTNQDNLLCSGLELVPEGEMIGLDIRVNEAVVGAVQNGADLRVFIVEFTENANGNAICEVAQYTLANAALFTTIGGEATGINVVTAIAFDDTVCSSAGSGSGSGSNGGNGSGNGNGNGNGNNQGGNNGNDGGNSNPASPVRPNPPTGGSGGNSDFPGSSDISLLTGGTTGSISTVVVGSVGATSVALFAFFAVVFGLNNTKKDPEVPIDALLDTTESSHLTSDNPIFQAMPDANTNVLA